MTGYTLTPSDVMDLRHWRKTVGASVGRYSREDLHTSAPYIMCSRSDGCLMLVSGTFVVAAGLAPQVMCALLHAEALQPGFCAQLADSRLTIEEALRTPQERQEALRRQSAANAKAKLELEAAQAAARRRRVQLVDPVTKIPAAELSLDDLLG